MTRTRRAFAMSLALLIAAPLSGCDDEPPAGLIDALTHALMGRLLGCGTQTCTGVGELNISTTDDEAALQTKFTSMVGGWCPGYDMTTERINRERRGQFQRNTQYSVSVVGFGQLSVRARDFSAEVVAQDDGWKTQINHTHSQNGSGMCPPQYTRVQCKVRPRVEVISRGEVTLSWIAGTETKTATAKGEDVIRGEFATAQEWCEKTTHGLPLECSGGTIPTCTQSADCANLPCGEWDCQGGMCTQLEKAPDGTPCTNGTCTNGACVTQ